MLLPNRATDNPFSAQRLSPGAIGFIFGQGESIEDCLRRLDAGGGWGQIRGPHGSGKSTLLHELMRRLRERPRRVERFTLHGGERRLPVSGVAMRSWGEGVQVAIDGFEQLSAIRRWRLKRLCRRQRCGLLVTTHRDLGLPDIFVTRPTPEIGRRIAARLQHGWRQQVEAQEVDRLFHAHGGDLREVLFALYDLFEARQAATG
ncbi:MAG: hypothetical protein KY475_19810 [Planctomycetes bacterium]|nr:hypothetical protein [Planctomycetota bacterium]